jgi:transmembrane sensor
MTHDHRDDAIDDAARAWLIRMRGPDAHQLRHEFETWHNADPANKAAYERAEAIMAQSAILKGSVQHGRARKSRPAAQRPFMQRWLTAGALAAAAAMLFVAISAGGASLSGPNGQNPMAAWAAEPLVTRHGEIRSFRLDDGSVVTLDTDSRLDVALTGNARIVKLGRGRARLQIATDVRPFRILAGAGQVTTAQASLDIGYDTDGMIGVTLSDGAAVIAPVSQTTRKTVFRQLPAGRPLSYRAEDARLRLEARPLGYSDNDWPSGWAEYRTVRLDQLVAAANRYAAVPIIVEDPALARLEASGRFRISQTDTFVRRLAQLFDLAIERRANGIYLQRR